MGFARLKEMVENSYNAGQNWWSGFRKVPSIASTAGSVIDFSMAPGSPKPNFYLGNEREATLLTASKGLYHGANVVPARKYLRKFAALSVSSGIVPVAITLLDYLMFYPLIDMDNTDEQTFFNHSDDITIPSLPRYTTGEGVQAFVVATNPYAGGGQFFIKYTNSNGVSGRTSRIMTINTNTTIATVIHSGVSANVGGTFINLAQGDIGIREIDSITFITPQGGLSALVLCKPIANVLVRDVDCWAEWDFLIMKSGLPCIYDGAYLNMIGAVNGNAGGQYLIGYIETVWN